MGEFEVDDQMPVHSNLDHMGRIERGFKNVLSNTSAAESTFASPLMTMNRSSQRTDRLEQSVKKYQDHYKTAMQALNDGSGKHLPLSRLEMPVNHSPVKYGMKTERQKTIEYEQDQAEATKDAAENERQPLHSKF